MKKLYIPLLAATSLTHALDIPQLKQDLLSKPAYTISTKVVLLMAAGVTFEDPTNVYISDTATVGTGTWVGAMVRITGNSSVGTNCTIRSGAIIDASTIGNNVSIGYNASILGGSNIGASCQVQAISMIQATTCNTGTIFWHRSSVFNSTIGSECNINPFTLIKECTISDNITIESFCHLLTCTVLAGPIGPFAVLKNQVVNSDLSVSPLE